MSSVVWCHLCCAAVRCELPSLFLQYGQVGVGVKGGMEAAGACMAEHNSDEDLCLLKIDM